MGSVSAARTMNSEMPRFTLRAWHRQAVKHGLAMVEGDRSDKSCGSGSSGGMSFGAASSNSDEDEVYASLMEAWNVGDTAIISRILKKQYAAHAAPEGPDDQSSKPVSPRSVATVCLGLARGDKKGECLVGHLLSP